jgi:aspartyl/asparaginyl-tRNA synthetase
MTVEEITARINAKGEEIRAVKTSKPPTMKEDLEPLVKELLALKLEYKNLTGEEFGGGAPKEEKKKKEGGEEKGQAEKQRKKDERIAKRAETNKATEEKTTTDDVLAHLYGDAPLIQSGVITDRVFVNIGDIKENMAGQKIWIRARLATSRAVGKGVFILLRQQVNTVQCVLWQGSQVSKGMVKYASAISLESIIDIQAEITKAETPIQSATVKTLELSIMEIHTVSRAQDLPFQVEDAGRNEELAVKEGLPLVNQDTMLNFRWIDTRTPANQAIFRIQSGVCQLFREYLNSRGFIEIHSPKLIGGASEGGANVFTLKYFDQPACLAQSPQFYKQMTAACGGFERVYEIGPVFRAENSNTHRHLCEFTGLDFEMAIYEHYYECLEVMGELFNFIFDGLNERYRHELMLISQQYPFEPLQYLRPPLRLTFQEGITMLRVRKTLISFQNFIFIDFFFLNS